MRTFRCRCFAAAMVVLAAGVFAQGLFAQGLAERVKPELDRAWAFGRVGQYDKQLEVYDKLLADAEVAKSRLSGVVKSMATGAAAAAKRPGEVIRRANDYLRGELDDRDQATILLHLSRAYAESGRAREATEAASRILALKEATLWTRTQAQAILAKARMDAAKSLEKANKPAEAVEIYQDLLARGGVPDETKAEAAERVLVLRGNEMGAERAAAFGRGVLEVMAEDDAKARVSLAMARTLVRLGALDEARQALAEVDALRASASYREQARALMGQELIRLADTDLKAKRSLSAAKGYETILETRGVSDIILRRATTGQIKALIDAERIDEAGRIVETYLDMAATERERASALALKIRVLLARNDVGAARECIVAVDNMPGAPEYMKRAAHMLLAGYQIARARALEARGERGEALRICNEVINNPKTVAGHYRDAVRIRLSLRPTVDQCDQLLAHVRSGPMRHYILFSKVEAQVSAGDREGARETAAVLLSHPDVTPNHKVALRRFFGGKLPKPKLPKLDDVQVAKELRGYEAVLASDASSRVKGSACLAMLLLFNRWGRPEEAIQRGSELLTSITQPYARQFIYRGLYNAQVMTADFDSATATVLAMLRQVRIPGVDNTGHMRRLAKEVVVDLAAQLSRHGRASEAKAVLTDLQAFLEERWLSAGEKRWCLETTFAAYHSRGDIVGALGFLRRHADDFSEPPPGFIPVIQSATGLVGKAELSPGHEITMGDARPLGLQEDIVFSARWYFRTEGAWRPSSSAYVPRLFTAVEGIYLKQGEPEQAARFIEDIVKDAPAGHKAGESAKYRAAELYIAAERPEQAKRALLELERKWPSSRERAELLLARIEAKEDVPAAIERLQKLHATARNSPLYFSSGELLFTLYEQQGQWEKALEVQKNMGKLDRRRLQSYANAKEQKAKRLEDALVLLAQYRQQRPNDHKAYVAQARCLVKLERFEEAFKVCEQACQYFPPGKRQRWALLQSAQICFDNLKRYKDAEERFRRFVTTYADSKDKSAAVAGLVRSLNELGNYREAIDRCKEFLATFGEDNRALTVRMLLYDAYMAQGKGSEAVGVLEETVAKHNMDRKALSSRMLLCFAKAHHMAGDKGKAEVFANEVIEKHGDDEPAVEAARSLLEEIK